MGKRIKVKKEGRDDRGNVGKRNGKSVGRKEREEKDTHTMKKKGEREKYKTVVKEWKGIRNGKRIKRDIVMEMKGGVCRKGKGS